jgi:hypothetical protein
MEDRGAPERADLLEEVTFVWQSLVSNPPMVKSYSINTLQLLSCFAWCAQCLR